MKKTLLLLIFHSIIISLFCQEQPKQIISKTFIDSILSEETTTKIFYNPYGMKMREHLYQDENLISEITYEYNKENQIIKEKFKYLDSLKISFGTNQTDDKVTRYFYDDKGREIEVRTCHIPRLNNPLDSCFLTQKKLTEYMGNQIYKTTQKSKFIGKYQTNIHHYLNPQLEIIESFSWDENLIEKSKFNPNNAIKSLKTIFKDENLKPLKEISCSAPPNNLPCYEVLYAYDHHQTTKVTKTTFKETKQIQKFDDYGNLILFESYEEIPSHSSVETSPTSLKFRKTYIYEYHKLMKEIHEFWSISDVPTSGVMEVNKADFVQTTKEYFY